MKSQARALALCIEGDSANLGAYIKIVRECDAQTILAAVVATLMRKHHPDGRGPLRRPGGYYTRRCQEYQASGIPAEVAAWVERCGHLPFQEIDAALEAASRVHLQTDDPTAASHQSATSGETPAPIYSPRQGSWMSRPEAEKLVERIAIEDPTVTIKGIQRVCLETGEVHVVDVVVDGVPYAFNAIRDWEDYRSRLREIEEADAHPGTGKGWGVWNA